MRIAVIGAGVSGLGAAHLLARAHDVTVFERSGSAGGHVRTVHHEGLALDTGFIVHNEPNYPLLTRLFRELGVRVQRRRDVVLGELRRVRPRMVRASARSHSPDVQSTRAFSPSSPRSCAGSAPRGARSTRPTTRSGRSRSTRPSAATRSASGRTTSCRSPRPSGRRRPSARSSSRPPTRSGSSTTTACSASGGTAGGRSPAAPRATCGPSSSDSATGFSSGSGCARCDAVPDGVELRTDDDATRPFDAVVVATHGDEALRLLGDPSDDEARVLGAWRSTRNEVVLH